MDAIRNRLEQDLKVAVSRLRQLGGVKALEDLLGPSGEHWSYADEVDEIQANERREIGFATRELLVERVNRLAAAIERLDDGEYGVCVECDEAIAPARLRVMPEVQTCVRCQDRLERAERHLEAVEVGRRDRGRLSRFRSGPGPGSTPALFFCSLGGVPRSRTPIIDLIRPGIHALSRAYFGLVLHGREHIPRKGPLLITPNHQTFADPPLVSIPFRRPIYYMAWNRLFSVPVFGGLIRRLRAFPVDIYGRDARATREAVRLLQAEAALMIFPEGERSTDGRVQRFKLGAFRLAVSLDVPVLPGHDRRRRSRLAAGSRLSASRPDHDHLPPAALRRLDAWTRAPPRVISPRAPAPRSSARCRIRTITIGRDTARPERQRTRPDGGRAPRRYAPRSSTT